MTDNPTLALRVFDSGEVLEKARGCIDAPQPDAETGEGLLDLLGLALAQQTVIDKDTRQALTNRPAEQGGHDCGINPAAEPAHHSPIANLLAEARNLVLDKAFHSPVGPTATHPKQEIVQDLAATLGMRHLGMKLHPEQAARGIATGRDRRVWRMGQH